MSTFTSAIIKLGTSLFNKIAGLQACKLIKKRFQHRCFPVKFEKFLRTPLYRTPSVTASASKAENGWCTFWWHPEGLFIWERVLRLVGKIISTRSRHNVNFHQQKSSIHMSWMFPCLNKFSSTADWDLS